MYFHTLSPLSSTDGLQWAGRWKYMWDRENKQAELYDLATDPMESSNLVATYSELAQALDRQLDRWRSRQLAWYHFPNLYQKFYPPRPPEFEAESQQAVEHFIDTAVDAVDVKVD